MGAMIGWVYSTEADADADTGTLATLVILQEILLCMTYTLL